MPEPSLPARDGFKGAIFDLDGVLVDTARYHFLAWKRLAEELGFDFTEMQNERLKGVSRMRSLEILLEIGDLGFNETKKKALCDRKNQWYIEYIMGLDATSLLPGALECLSSLQDADVPIALASASKNASVIVARLQIAPLFRYIVDAAFIPRAKPAPDIFLNAAKGIHTKPSDAVVFEDAPAGVEAAHAAGMYAVGVGKPDVLNAAELIVPDLSHLNVQLLFHHIA